MIISRRGSSYRQTRRPPPPWAALCDKTGFFRL